MYVCTVMYIYKGEKKRQLPSYGMYERLKNCDTDIYVVKNIINKLDILQ